MSDHDGVRSPERVDGPTPNGGAYSIDCYDEHGHLREIVEYNTGGDEIARTYNAPARRPPSW